MLVGRAEKIAVVKERPASIQIVVHAFNPSIQEEEAGGSFV